MGWFIGSGSTVDANLVGKGADSLAATGLAALPTALEEQVGLKITPAKLPTATLVIDHIERPSEN